MRSKEDIGQVVHTRFTDLGVARVRQGCASNTCMRWLKRKDKHRYKGTGRGYGLGIPFGKGSYLAIVKV